MNAYADGTSMRGATSPIRLKSYPHAHSLSLEGSTVQKEEPVDGEMTFEVALFPCLEKPLGHREAWTWATMCDRLAAYSIRPEKNGELVSFAVFRGNEVRRKNENVSAITALVVDCDESFTLDELRDIMEGLEARAILYSSHSHGSPDTVNHPDAHAPGERYRVVLPLAKPVPADCYHSIWERMNLLFEGEIDQACKALAQAFFLPSHPTGSGFAYQVFEGRLLNPDDLPELPAAFYQPTFISPSNTVKNERPGDAYNAQASSDEVACLLESAGWRVLRSISGVFRVKRPGKKGAGISGTIGYHGQGIFHNFSSSAAQFEAGRAYRPFDVYTRIRHAGDYKAAAQDLYSQGYGHAAKIEDREITKEQREVVVAAITCNGLPALTVNDIPSYDYMVKEKPEYDDEQIRKLLHPEMTAVSLKTEMGHQQRALGIFGEDYSYCREIGSLHFDSFSGTWIQDDKESTLLIAKLAALAPVVKSEGKVLMEYASALRKAGRDSDAIAMQKAAMDFSRHAERVENFTFCRDVARFMQGNKCSRIEQFAPRPWRFAFKNCVFDKGQWRMAQRDDYLLTRSPVELEPSCNRHEWEALLHRITGGDKEFARTLQDVCAYAISGASSLRTIVWLYGPSGTGKSTVCELLQTILGQSAATLDTSCLKEGASRERLGAQIAHKLAAFVTEAGNLKAGPELLKTLSGADSILARYLYKETFTVTPSHVLILSANDAPQMDAYDEALRDRVVALPFSNALREGNLLEFEGHKRVESARKDVNGALVRGFAAWVAEGLENLYRTQKIYVAPSVEKATETFWEDTDPMTPFWEGVEEVSANNLRRGIIKGKLREIYDRWAEEEEQAPLRPRQFTNACKVRGLEEKRSNGKDLWVLKSTTVGKVGKQHLISKETEKERKVFSESFENNTTLPTLPTDCESDVEVEY